MDPRTTTRLLVLAALAALAGCASTSPTTDAAPATDAADATLANGCPVLTDPVARAGDPAGGDTWATYARGFFAANCARCHATTRVTPTDRGGAPADFNWDVEATVRANLARIRNAVGVLNYMPINEPGITCADRLRLVRWIDVGAP